MDYLYFLLVIIVLFIALAFFYPLEFEISYKRIYLRRGAAARKKGKRK